MLVLDPTRRYSIEKIKRHRWMLAEVVEMPITQPISSACGTSAYEPNEQILRLMSNLGIDAQKTRESLKLNSYDHHAAIYLLLMERLKHRSMSQDGTAVGHMGKHPSLEQQKRRPSSIAEQAMRKLGLSHQRSLDPSISPRHHHMSTNVDPMQSALIGGPLRESNIRESAIFTPGVGPGNATALRSSAYNASSGLSSNMFLNREREFINNPGGHSPLYPVTPSGLSGPKESSTALIQKEIQSGISSLGISHRAPSNRLLSSGLDQRILKQSSEDCRRLLQQVRPPIVVALWVEIGKLLSNKYPNIFCLSLFNRPPPWQIHREVGRILQRPRPRPSKIHLN